jgi:hypothetical protein
MQIDGMIRKSVLFPEDLWGLIQDWRFDQRIGTEAEAVRTLVQMGMHYDKLRKHPDFDRHEATMIDELNSQLAG